MNTLFVPEKRCHPRVALGQTLRLRRFQVDRVEFLDQEARCRDLSLGILDEDLTRIARAMDGLPGDLGPAFP